MKIVFFVLLALGSLWSESVGIVGSGYVGLVMSEILASWGHQVICIDIDADRIRRLQEGKLPLYEPNLGRALFSGLVEFSSDFSQLQKTPIVYLCVGTPSNEKGECDIRFVQQAMQQLAPFSPEVVCIKSTISPGSFRKIAGSVDLACDLVYNPEFMREGSALQDIAAKNPVVIGSDSEEAMSRIEALYRPLFDLHPELELIRTTPETAELIKYGWNGFSALRITYFNELSRLCASCSGDFDALMRGIAWSERLLPTEKIVPGLGFGGSCLPKDTQGLARVFEEEGSARTLIHQTIESNSSHFLSLWEKIDAFIGSEPQTVGVLGVSFKSNTDDVRLAPSLRVIQNLLNRGHRVKAFDPRSLDALGKILPLAERCATLEDAAADCDCLIVMTEWDEIKKMDLNAISRLVRQKKLVDFKNLFSPLLAEEAGFMWINLGRRQ